MAMLRASSISVYYGDIQAVADVCLEIEQGEIVSLIGSNGAGKTTIVNTVSGLLKPRGGEVIFNDRVLNGVEPFEIVRAGVVQIPEARRLFVNMTVIENLQMGAFLPSSRRMYQENLDKVFASFPILDERKAQLAGTLSGGEQQMLAIARGLMSNPKLLVLDEPSLGLAPILVSKIFQIIQAINKMGITILLVEQNVAQSLRISQRGYVLENGRIRLEADSAELLANPYVIKAYLGI